MPTNEELFYRGEPESKWEVHGDQWENASTKCIPTRSAVLMTLRLKSYSIRPLNHYACHTISSSGSGLDRTLLIVARKTMKAKAVLTCMAGITRKKNTFKRTSRSFTFKVDYLVTAVNLTIKLTNTRHRSLSSFTGPPLKMRFSEIQLHLVNLKFQIMNLNNLFSESIHWKQSRIGF